MECPNSLRILLRFLLVSFPLFFFFAYGICICRNPSRRSSAKAARPCENGVEGNTSDIKDMLVSNQICNNDKRHAHRRTDRPVQRPSKVSDTFKFARPGRCACVRLCMSAWSISINFSIFHWQTRHFAAKYVSIFE